MNLPIKYMRLVALYAILFVSHITVNAQLSNGLVAHWPFSGNAGDSSGNGNNGVSIFMTYGQSENGIAGKAAQFDGTNSHINVAYKAGMNLTQYTICAIVKPTGYYTGLCQGNVIIQRSNETLKGYYGLLFSDNPYNDCNTLDTGKFTFYPSATAPNPSILQYTPNIVSNTWYYLVATCNNDTIKFYLNGQLKASYITNNPTGTSTEGLTIGALYQQTAGGTFPYWFKGLIDDIRIYNRVLTTTEIRQYSRDVYIEQPLNTSLCKSTPFTVNYNTVNEFQAANVFTVELSDASGSFASATALGTVNAARGGNILCTIPGATPVGGGYKLRIRSSMPTKISDTISGLTVSVPTTPPTSLVTVAPGTSVANGTTAFFSAIASNAGSSPIYIWKKNGVALPGIGGFTLTATAGLDFVTGDTMSVTIKSSNLCAIPDSAESNKLVMTVLTVGVPKVVNTTPLTIFPNPSNGKFEVKGTTDNGEIELSLYNTVGQKVWGKKVNVLDNKLEATIEVSSLSSGIYYLRIDANNSTNTYKLMVKQ